MDLETKNELNQIKSLLTLLLPKVFTIRDLMIRTGKSRQAIIQYLERNYEPEVDYYKKNGKIYVKIEVAAEIIQRSL